MDAAANHVLDGGVDRITNLAVVGDGHEGEFIIFDLRQPDARAAHRRAIVAANDLTFRFGRRRRRWRWRIFDWRFRLAGDALGGKLTLPEVEAKAKALDEEKSFAFRARSVACLLALAAAFEYTPGF